METARDSEDEPRPTKSFPCGLCDRFILKQTNNATGFGMFRMGNGPLLMSNVFLSTAFLTMARKDIGCYHEDDDVDHPECGTVYGFKPTSLLTNIALVSALLSAFLLPIIGAVTDCTDHRYTIGKYAALSMMTIQAVQIGSFQSTWFVMAVLQAVNGFIYQIQTLTAYAYIPDIGREVGQTTMNKYTADYSAMMFLMQALYAVVVLAFGASLGLGDESLGRLGQGVNVPISSLFYFFAWYFFTPVSARRQLDDNKSLLTDGFSQVWRTAKGVKKHYPSTLGWFFLAVVFAEAAASAFLTAAVTYMSEVIKFDGVQIGILIMIVLFSTLPGSYFGAWVTSKTDPKKSMQLNLIVFIVFNFIGFLTMTGPDPAFLPYTYGVGWGIILGWFYPVELMIYSAILPKGQETELSGFFLYCTQIMGWLPLVVFTTMNENDLHLKWAAASLNIYFAISLVFYCLMGSWEECKANGVNPNKMIGEEGVELTGSENKDFTDSP